MWLCGKKDVRIQTNRPCQCKKLKPFSPSLSKIPSYAYLLLQLLQLWRQSLWACRWVRQHRIEQNPRFQRKHIFFIKIAGSTWLGLLEWEKLPIFDEKRWPSLAKSKTDATCLGGTPCSWSQDLWKKPLGKNPIDFKSLHSPKHLGLEPENWPSPAEEEILLLWHHHFQANRLGGSTICKQNKPQLSQVIQGFIIIDSTSMLKLSCSVVDRDTSQVNFWCFTGHPKMMCIQKDENLIEVTFSKKDRNIVIDSEQICCGSFNKYTTSYIWKEPNQDEISRVFTGYGTIQCRSR